MTLITAADLTVSFGAVTVLDRIEFAISKGEIVTVIGPNGSGKSTFLRALLGMQKPSSGCVTRREGLKVGYVPQGLHIDVTLPMTVRRFLSLPVRHSGSDIAEVLVRVGVGGFEERQMATLSGGQFQRVLLARALLASPDILILDEPTQALDQPGVAAFYRLIEEVRRETGCAVLMVSHDLHVVMSASDRVICLNRHICCEGAPMVVSAAPEYRALFGLGTGGAFALYQHVHDHDHDHPQDQKGHAHHHHDHEGNH